MIHELTLLFSEVIILIERYRTLLLLLVCFVLGAGGARLIADIPFRSALLDYPDDRSSHTVPTPRGGGIGILLAFIIAAMTLKVPTTFLFAVVLISVVSFYGDFLRISVSFRLVIQFLAGVVCLLPLLPRLGGYYDISLLSAIPAFFPVFLILILLFLIGSANFYNFMDGINGIAGLSGSVGFGLLWFYTYYRPFVTDLETSFSLLSLCMAIACLGFLPFNMPRARVFMGDVGSILLGFVFAALVLMLARNFRDLLSFAALLFLFYADELTTMYARYRAGEDLLQPHRRHLYQLLVNECGIDHWKVTVSYGIAQMAIGLGVFAVYSMGIHVVLLLLLFCFSVFLFVTYLIRMKVRSVRQ